MVNSHRDDAQRLVNVYVKTLKWMKSHSAEEIAAKMPPDYIKPSMDLDVTAVKQQLPIFGSDCKMPAGGPETVLNVLQTYVPKFKGQAADLSKTYTKRVRRQG